MSESAAPRAEGARGTVEVIEPSPAQRAHGRAVAESKATIPHGYASTGLDLEPCAGLLAEDPALSPTDLVLRASALALRACPHINAAYRDGRFELYSRINVAFAAASREAIVTPVIVDADRKRLTAIAAESARLAERVGDGSITRPELSGATFTVSDCGPGAGSTTLTPVIATGQAAALGIGAVEERALVRSDGIEARPALTATLAYDARIVLPADADGFLREIGAALIEPGAL